MLRVSLLRSESAFGTEQPNSYLGRAGQSVPNLFVVADIDRKPAAELEERAYGSKRYGHGDIRGACIGLAWR